MAKKNRQINQRLAAISSAKPVTSSPPPKFSNTGRSERCPVYRLARLLYVIGQSVNCIVKDVSNGGARVAIEGNFQLPEKMTLKMEQAGITKRVRLA